MEKRLKYEIIDDFVMVSKEDYQTLTTTSMVEDTHISLVLLNMILECDDLFEYTLSVFKGIRKKFLLTVKSNDPIFNGCSKFLTKKDLFYGLSQAIRFGLINLTTDERERFHKLKETIYFNFYENEHKDDIFEINIEGEDYKINVKDMFDFIGLNPLDCGLKMRDKSHLYGIKKEYFLYALSHYFKEKQLRGKFEFSHYQNLNLDAIMNNTYVDIQAFNKFLSTKDTIYKDVRISPELRDAVWSGMSDDFTLLEKVIYIYIKLCKTLTYDPEFYASRQKGKVLDKHKSIEHIEAITPQNNEAVCFEFNAIFTRFLYELGINFSSSYVNEVNEAYGAGHVNVEFRVGKFLILADAITSIFTGDLFGAKVDKKLVGFMCLNLNKDTIKEFNESLDKVTQYIKDNDNLSENERGFDDYALYASFIKSCQLYDKIEILKDNFLSTKRFKIMDMFSYIMMLGKMVFTSSELNNNIKFEIIKSNDTKDGVYAYPLGILTINMNGFSNNIRDNKYFVYDIENGLVRISIDELAYKFDKNIYEHIDEKTKNIPGLALARRNNKMHY